MTFSHYLKKKGFSPSTQRSYYHCVRSFSSWLEEKDLRVALVGHSELLGYLEHLRASRYSTPYIHQHIHALRHWFFYQRSLGLLDRNPMNNLRLRPANKRIPHDLLPFESLENLFVSHPETCLLEQRDHVIVGLMVYQALRPEELTILQPPLLDLVRGKLRVPATRRGAARSLPLQAGQILLLLDYLEQVRPALILQRGLSSDRLIMSSGQSCKLNNTLNFLLKKLRRSCPELLSWQQVRQSVIAHWLKTHNLRQVQYWAGHKHISTTERYRFPDLEGLINRFHPMEHFPAPPDSE